MKEIIKDKEEKEFTYPCLMYNTDSGIVVYVTGINGSGLEGFHLTGMNKGERKIEEYRFMKPFEGSITLSND